MSRRMCAAPRRAHADSTNAAPAAASKATAPSTADAAGLVPMGDFHYAGSVVQRRESDSADRIDRTTRADRTGLPDELKANLETLSGVSLENVNVHYRSPKPAQLHAHAYAQGSDIHLAPGQERHLPHEAWHVVQQAQGRVRATASLAGQDINHDPRLEHEADRMGERAQSGGASSAADPPPLPTPSQTAPSGDAHAPVQAVFIVRSGVVVWENDPYVLQPGESYLPQHQQQPSVLVDEGTQEIRLDSSGSQSKRKRDREVPTHDELQTVLEKQGKQLRTRLKDNPSSIRSQTKQLSDLADRLEKHAGSSVPSEHKKKIKTLHGKGTTTGKQFRAVIKAQDEYTQSQASAARLRGFRSRGGDTPLRARADLEEYAEQLLRVLSSLRAPTESIVAPVDDSGTLTGQQHPTSRSQPKLPGGSSGHSYADRARVESQVLTHNEAIRTNAPANSVLLASILSAIVATLSSMSAPTSALNLPSFNPSRQELQGDERQRIKDQGNEIATEIGLPINTDEQDYDAPWAAHSTPSSPKRRRKNDPKLPPKTTPPPVAASSSTVDPLPTASSASTAPIPRVAELALAIQYTVAQLQAVISPPEDFEEFPFRNFLDQLQQAMADVDQADPQNEQRLGSLFASLNVVFHYFESRRQIHRRVVTNAPPTEATGPQGQRLPALEQFFAECGQMAAHNALVLAQFPDLDNPATIAALTDEAALRQLGPFVNQLGENQIRAMITGAGRWNVPVIGSLDQLQTVLGYLAAWDVDTLIGFGLNEGELWGAEAFRQFVAGETQSLVMVVNTNSHQDESTRGYHWITVRVTRTVDGELAIHYADSLTYANDYSELFAALRLSLGQGLGGGGGGDGGDDGDDEV